MLIPLHEQAAYAYTGSKVFDPSLPTAVFLHGAQNDHSVWGLQSRYFAHHGWSVLAVDLPGHGRSAGQPLSSVEAMADWVQALLDALKVERAVLIGHSMGSLIALEVALRLGQRALGIALVGTAYPMKVSPQLLEEARDREAVAIDRVNLWSHASIAAKPSAPGPGFYVPEVSRKLMQRVARGNPSPVFFTDFSACNAYAHGEEAAAALHCPCVFVLGRKDQMTHAKAAAPLIQKLPQAQVVQLDNCGHALMAEQPDQVLDTLFKFATDALK